MGARRLPGETLDFVQRARVAIVRRQYAEAVKICRLGLLGQPTLLEGRLVLGMALSALGRHDEVLQEMRVALETDPQSALGWLMKSEALVGKGDLAQAELALDRARTLDPTNPKVELVGQAIDSARASGAEEMPIESTGTREYPARNIADVKWRSTQSLITSLGTAPRGLDGPTDQAAIEPGTREVGDDDERENGGEVTRVDPEPTDDNRPALLPVTMIAPAKLPSVAAPPAPHRPTPPVEPPAASPGPSAPLHVSGPEEATMFGLPRGAAAPAPTIEPPASRADRPTRELAAPPADASAPALQLPSGAHTMMAPHGEAPVSMRAVAEARRRQQVTKEEGGWDSPDEVTSRRPPAPTVEPRVTKEVAALEPRGFEAPVGTESSISLSEEEIVFAPSTGDSIELPASAPPELDEIDVRTGHPEPRRRPPSPEPPRPVLVERAEVPQARVPVKPAAAVQFVAQVPLQGMLSASTDRPPREELQPRVSADPSPRGRKAPHLAHGHEPRPLEPRPAERPVEPRPSEPRAPQRRPSSQSPSPGDAAVPPPAGRKAQSGRSARGPRRAHGLLSRALEALSPDPRRGRRNWLAIGGVLVAVVATGVIAGLVVREWRLRSRVERRHELAVKKLGGGSYAGYQAAEVLYRQILAERDDRRAAVLRAKVLAQLAFEFGEPPEPAQRALSSLSSTNAPEAREARIYLALAKGELDLASREAAALLRERPSAQARYLVGQAQLLLDRPEDAATALRSAAAEDPQNPIVLHALGLAEAALHRQDRAFEAYGRALTANASHVATIIDRALLQLRQGLDREAAAGSLEGVVGKLVGDASPGQLARAYVGLAEIELQKGNVAAARSALSSAAARRRDHPLLLEELAEAYADAFELDPAEREAKRALALSGRLQPRLVLAEVALRRSRPVQALSVLEESGSSRPEALVLRALAKLELGRYAEARSDAELATHLDPRLVPAAVAVARVDIGEGKYDAALRRLEALEAQDKYAEVANALGQVYLAQRMPDRARTFFRQALVRQPLLLEARLSLARLLHDAGQLTEARDEVKRILATNAAYVPARRELAALALDLGDAIAARDEFDALTDREPDVDTLLGAARAHLLLGDARGAEDRADRALRLRPSGPELESVYATKVRALLLDHRANEAIQLLLKVVRTAARGELPALFIEAYLDFGRVDWAERAIDVAPVAARTGVELTLAKARLALAQGRQEAARSLAEEAQQRLRARRAPVWLRAQALALVGQAELELGQSRAASKDLRAALDLDPRNTRAQHQLGLAYLEQKHLEDAAAAFEGAIASDARFAEAHYYLGWTRRALGDARADEPLRAYLELEPKGALAEDARRMLHGGEITQTSDPPRSRHRRR